MANSVFLGDTFFSLPGQATGDLFYASSPTAIAGLPDVAAGSVLVSGGVGAAPAWSATPAVTSLSAVSGLFPSVSDGCALGSTSLMWADLFLAAGSVLNFNNGNVTLTHSAGALTLNTGTTFFGWAGIKLQQAATNRMLVTTGVADYLDINAGTVTIPNGASFNIAAGGSTSISTGVGSVKMSSANPADNTAWIPIKYAGTTYYVPAWTTNAP